MTAIAFKFFEPITAPGPVRAACLPPSLVILANFTKFSPAGPIQAIRKNLPNFSFSLFSVSKVEIPFKSDPGRNSTPSCEIFKTLVLVAFPLIIRASQPLPFSAVAKKLEDKESPIKLVSGDFVTTANLLEVVNLLPTKGLHAKIKGLAGSKGSVLGFEYLYNK